MRDGTQRSMQQASRSRHCTLSALRRQLVQRTTYRVQRRVLCKKVRRHARLVHICQQRIGAVTLPTAAGSAQQHTSAVVAAAVAAAVAAVAAAAAEAAAAEAAAAIAIEAREQGHCQSGAAVVCVHTCVQSCAVLAANCHIANASAGRGSEVSACLTSSPLRSAVMVSPYASMLGLAAKYRPSHAHVAAGHGVAFLSASLAALRSRQQAKRTWPSAHSCFDGTHKQRSAGAGEKDCARTQWPLRAYAVAAASRRRVHDARCAVATPLRRRTSACSPSSC
jgi:hypothetical protein